MSINKTWTKLEKAFLSESVKIRTINRPNLDKLFDTEEHLIQTTKGVIHVSVELEMVGNILMPLVVYSTASKELQTNFHNNSGYVILQQLSHELKQEYDRMLNK